MHWILCFTISEKESVTVPNDSNTPSKEASTVTGTDKTIANASSQNGTSN